MLFGEERWALIPLAAAADQLSKLTGPASDTARRSSPAPQFGAKRGPRCRARPRRPPAARSGGDDHQRRQRCQCQRRRHQTSWVACVAVTASPMTTPLAGIAEAAETPYSPIAAAVPAAKAIILSVIAPSLRTKVETPAPKRPGRNGCSTPSLLHGRRKRRASAAAKYGQFGEDHAQIRTVPIAI
jgi:hypothetical protein